MERAVMKQIVAKDLREKTDQELTDQMRLIKKEQFDSMVRGASGEAIKPHEKRQGRRLIARIQTILRERVLRKGLAVEVQQLEPQTQGATPSAARFAQAAPRPYLPRVKAPPGLAPADRAAFRLAEAKRRHVGLQREDPGQAK
jgi:ribosomal protein L29